MSNHPKEIEIKPEDLVFNPGSERNLISICLRNKDRIVDVDAKGVFAEHFAVPGHKYIYMAMTYLYGKQIAPTPMAIMEVLSSEEAKKKVEELGGLEYLTVLSESFVPDDNMNIFIDKVKQSYTRSNLAQIGKEAIRMAFSEQAEVLNPSELIGFVEQKISDLSINSNSVGEVYKMGDDTERVLTERAETPSQIPGLETGFEQFDEYTRGGREGDLIIVCAESKTGKSVLLTNIANKICVDDKIPGLYFDTEMSERQQEDRLLAMRTGIPEDEITSGMYVMDTHNGTAEEKVAKLKKAREDLKMGNYYHVYMPNFTIEKVNALARRFYMQMGIKVIFFDYIKIPASQGNFRSSQEYQMLGFFTSGLKDLAGMLRIPIYSACQANREDLGNTEKDASSIGGSYRILQLATKLCFLTNRTEEQIAKYGIQTVGNQVLQVKYQRNGQSDCPPINIFFNRPILRQTEV